ncbi:hypothetical protein [Stenotrophomonas sp. AB1(2024)]|jgi:hypothetical protein|uniref:hypothetical protein n=1 Tax=Stenotrophomonas sp. AB1(2024) TaxID=3132215 RepID=UPI0030A1C9DD
MNSLSGPEDAYRSLVEKGPEGWIYGLVAFAVLEEQRIEWMRHIESRSGCLPNSEQIREWYEQQPASTLIRARGTAESMLGDYAEDLAKSMDENHRRAILDDVIVAEIRSNNRFWPQFGANVAAGLVGTVLFSVLLVLIVLVALRDPSPVAMIKQVQEVQRGK